MLKAGKETIKYINKQNVLHTFLGAHEVSKTEVVEATKLNPATVSTLIQELVRDGYLHEVGYGESSGGRKPMLYSINHSISYVLTVKITVKGIQLAVLDLKAEIVCYKSVPCIIASNDQLHAILQTAYHDLRTGNEAIFDAILCVAYSVPGVIDYSARKLLFSAPLNVDNFDFAQLTEQLLGDTTESYIFKDTDALLLGEYYKHKHRKKEMRLAYILCENGVGMSLLSGKELLCLDNCGLEVGHTTIDMNGKACKCSFRGCAGTMIGEMAALQRYAELSEQQRPDVVLDLATLSYDEIITMHLDGHDNLARQVVHEQLDVLCILLTNIVNLFNPDVIIVGGALGRLPEVQTVVASYLKHTVLKPFSHNLTVQSSTLPVESSFYGMGKYILHRTFFKSISI